MILMCLVLESGQIDIVWDYIGIVLIVYNYIEDKFDFDQIYQKVKELDVLCGLIWFNQLELNNIYVFVMLCDVVEKYYIYLLQDFVNCINEDDKEGNKQYLLGVDYEFVFCFDGLGLMQELYGFKLDCSEVKQMDFGLVYMVLKNE